MRHEGNKRLTKKQKHMQQVVKTKWCTDNKGVMGWIKLTKIHLLTKEGWLKQSWLWKHGEGNRFVRIFMLSNANNKKHLDWLLHSEALGQGWIKRIEEFFLLFLVKCSVKYSSFSIWANKRSYISFYKVQHLLTEFQLFFLMSNCFWIILLCPGLMSNVTSYILLFHYIILY